MGFEKLSFSRFLVSSRSPKHPLFLSRNGSVRSNCVAKRSKDAARGTKGEREREKIGEKRGVPYARTIEKKLAAILAPPHGQLPTRLPLSASLPPPALPSLPLCRTPRRVGRPPRRIKYNREEEGREIITRLIGDERQGFVVYSYSKPISSGTGEFRFSFPRLSRLGNLEKRERSFTFST